MTAVTEDFICRMWAEGVPVPKIAQYLNWSPITVRRQAQQLGLPARRVGRPRNGEDIGDLIEAVQAVVDCAIGRDDQPNQTQSTQSET